MSSAVNKPVDVKQKEKDVNQKLQLYGIYSAFANGKVPSNKQIDVALNSALGGGPIHTPPKGLSSEGQKLVADFRDVIEKAKVLLLTKNEGNLLQDFIWQTQGLSTGDAQKPNLPVDKDTARQHGNEALEGLRTLGTLIISNGQFRKLLNDAVTLMRDVAGDAATNVAGRVNPTQEQLDSMDRPADDNTWHDVPDLSKDNLRNQVQSRAPFGKKEAKDIAGNATQEAHPSGSRDPADAAELAARDQQQGGNSGVDAQAGARTAVNQVKDQIPEDQKDRMRETRDRTREKTVNYMKEKMPQERREQVIWRLKKMIVECQGHPDYMRAIETLLRLAEEYTGHSKNLAGQGTGAVKGAHTDAALQKAEADMKTLIERFANSTSLDDLFDAINQIYRDADQDPELRGWFTDVDRFVRKCLKEQGYVLQDQSTDEYNRLYDRGHFLLRERYRNHTDRVTDLAKFYSSEFEKDPLNKAFGDSMNKLFTDLGNDENGKPTFKPHLVKDLTDVIFPYFFENVRYIPIPRIEYSDNMMDAIVENLVIEGDNLAPNVLEFGSDNYWRWGRKQTSNKNKNKVMLSVSGVQADLRDVSYYIKKKSGFPSITDKGVADIFLGGQGFSFKVQMETADDTDKNHFFKITKVDVDVKHLNIKLKSSNHKLLFGLFKPLLLKVMNPALTKVLEQQIRQNVNQLDSIAYEIKKEADRAQAEAQRNPDPEHIQNMYQRYYEAAQKRFLQGKEKTEQATADKKVNVAVTQHDSIFQNIKLPGGISSKATEYKELAAKGDKWESPVFSIGEAKESTNLTKAAPITRKGQHLTTSPGLRGPNGEIQGGATGGPGQVTSGGNYGQTTGTAGYGQTGTTGYGQTTGGTGILGQPQGNTGSFSNQVDNAFSSGTTGTANGGVAPTDTQHTTLGAKNPVLSGNV